MRGGGGLTSLAMGVYDWRLETGGSVCGNGPERREARMGEVKYLR